MLIKIFVIFLFYILYQCLKILKIYNQKEIKEEYDDLPKTVRNVNENNFDIHHEPFNNNDVYEFGLYRSNPLKHSNEIDTHLAELRNGMVILDAGCGLLGPAKYILNKFNKIKIHAITNAESRYKLELKKVINDKRYNNRLKIHFDNFNNIDTMFKKMTFDRILFMESINYANDIDSLLNKTHTLLKNKGKIYIRSLMRYKTDKENLIKKFTDIENKLDMNIYTHENMISLLQKAGYSNIKYSTVPLLFSENFNYPIFYLTLKKLKLLSSSYLYSGLNTYVGYYIGTKNNYSK